MGKKERLNEGFVRTNNKTSRTEKPKIEPAPQKPSKPQKKK